MPLPDYTGGVNRTFVPSYTLGPGGAFTSIPRPVTAIPPYPFETPTFETPTGLTRDMFDPTVNAMIDVRQAIAPPPAPPSGSSASDAQFAKLIELLLARAAQPFPAPPAQAPLSASAPAQSAGPNLADPFLNLFGRPGGTTVTRSPYRRRYGSLYGMLGLL